MTNNEMEQSIDMSLCNIETRHEVLRNVKLVNAVKLLRGLL